MKTKNLVLLTSLIGVSLSLTPSIAHAADNPEATATSQSSNDIKEDDGNKYCYPLEDIPVPQNKYLKLFYDFYKVGEEKDRVFEAIKNTQDEEFKYIQKLVDEGKISQKEADERKVYQSQFDTRGLWNSTVYEMLSTPVDKDFVEEAVNAVYDDPDDIDNRVKEIISSFSTKDILDYLHIFSDPQYHVVYSDKDLKDKYQKEYDKLDEHMTYDEKSNPLRFGLWSSAPSEEVKAKELVEGFDSKKDQVEGFTHLHDWLSLFPTKEDYDNKDHNKGDNETEDITGADITGAYGVMANNFLQELKNKGKDNDDFYKEMDRYYIDEEYFDKAVEKYDNTASGDLFNAMPRIFKEKYGFDKFAEYVGKYHPIKMSHLIGFLNSTDLDIPFNIECSQDERNSSTTSKDKDKDKDTSTTSTTSTTYKKEDDIKEDNNKVVDVPTPQPNNTGNISTPHNNQVSQPAFADKDFNPVKHSNPGDFAGGISSSIEEGEGTDGIKADTGGSSIPTIFTKIRSLF